MEEKPTIEAKIELERTPEGRVVNSLRNKDIIGELEKKYKGNGSVEDMIKKIDSIVGEGAYVQFSASDLFDPRNPNVVYRTREQAIKAVELGRYINELDEKYLEEKSKK